MSRYGFLATRRWVGTVLVALLVSAACVGLGLWQWDRHAARAATNAVVEANYDREPVPLTDVVEAGAPVAPGDVWRPVELVGRYTGNTVRLRNRPVDGTPAVRVLTPFRAATPAGDVVVVVVDRGWVSTSTEGEPVVPPAPSGEVRLVGRLRQAEDLSGRPGPSGQVYAIAPEEVLPAAGVDGGAVLDGYVLAVRSDPAPPEELAGLPRPETDPGPHLSYAFQWWVFAVGALVGVVVLARREAADGEAALPGAAPGGARRRRGADEEEDALIDAQLRRPRDAADPRAGAS